MADTDLTGAIIKPNAAITWTAISFKEALLTPPRPDLLKPPPPP
jgi:hypothetical protein